MDFCILGPLEVRDGVRLLPLHRKKHRALLALLVLRASEAVSADVLVEDLWGAKPPKTAREALHNYVSQLRKELGADVLQTRDQAYVLAVEPEQVDAFRFESLAARAREAGSADERAGGLREALSLWRGPPLEEFAYEPFAAAEIGRLADLRLAARKDLIDAELELGRHAELVPQIEALVAENPFRERLRGQLMLALYRCGRQADALAAYQDARRALMDELGLEPSAALRDLEQAILRQDPALDLPAVLPSVEERRKTVTVLFAELPSGTGLDPERMREIAVRARAGIELHGGAVEARGGDELLGVFGVPTTHEDDALRALRAASELGEDIRVGVDTGEVLTGQGFVSGGVLSTATSLQRAAAPGEVWLGEATLAVCRDAVVVEPVDGAFRLVEVVEHASGVARALDAPLVGREQELAALEAAYAEARAEGQCRLVVVSGEPGIGKTRLARELFESLEDKATGLVGRCASYGAGAPWRPLAEMLDQAGEQLDPILAGAGSPGEVFLGARRILERLAAEKPLVLAFDDLQWAEPTLLDFVDYVAAQAKGPMLCLCLTRPELLDARTTWDETALRLEPLADHLAAELASEVGSELRLRVVEAAGGNPLFVEQLVAFAQEGGSLDTVPPSVEALIAARLDLLEAEERGLLQRAAVVGRLFARAAVQELGADATRLTALQGKGFVRRLRTGYRFHHVLVRDVAYASLPKAERAELHERLADWLDGRGETDEIVGYHLEQGYRLREELGRAGGRAPRLAVEAGERLGRAGIEAFKRGESRSAIALLARAAPLLPRRDRLRVEVLCELGLAARTAGDFDRAEHALLDALEVAVNARDRAFELRARLELAAIRTVTQRRQTHDELLDIAAEALPVFEAVADTRGLARVWRMIAYVHGSVRLRFASAAEAAERATDYYARTGWSTAWCLGELALALHSGPTPAPTAIRRCRRLLQDVDLTSQVRVLPLLGGLEAMRGRFDEARSLLYRANATAEKLGESNLERMTSAEHFFGRIELLAGDASAAGEVFGSVCEVLERHGDRSSLATRSAELAEALYLQGRNEEADDRCLLARDLGSDDDLSTQILWRSTRAKVLARNGDLDEAEQLAREAVGLAEPTDALNYRGKAILDLTEVLARAGRADEAVEAGETAIGLFVQKGNVAAARQARKRLAELSVV